MPTPIHNSNVLAAPSSRVVPSADPRSPSDFAEALHQVTGAIRDDRFREHGQPVEAETSGADKSLEAEQPLEEQTDDRLQTDTKTDEPEETSEPGKRPVDSGTEEEGNEEDILVISTAATEQLAEEQPTKSVLDAESQATNQSEIGTHSTPVPSATESGISAIGGVPPRTDPVSASQPIDHEQGKDEAEVASTQAANEPFEEPLQQRPHPTTAEELAVPASVAAEAANGKRTIDSNSTKELLGKTSATATLAADTSDTTTPVAEGETSQGTDAISSVPAAASNATRGADLDTVAPSELLGKTTNESLSDHQAEASTAEPREKQPPLPSSFQSHLERTNLSPRQGTSAELQPADNQSVDAGKFVARVSRAFQAAEQRGGNVQLRLSPPELGAMKIELNVQQGVLTAKLETETSAAKNILLDNLPALRERLAAQEIRVDKFEVDVRQHGSGSDPDWQAGQDRQDNPTERRVYRPTGQPTQDHGSDTTSTEQPGLTTLDHDGEFSAVA